MQFGIDSLHTDTPIVENKIPELSSALRFVKRTRGITCHGAIDAAISQDWADQLSAVTIRHNVSTNTAYPLSRASGSVNSRGL
jgi:hypothetical protein